jgi:hypothetical protein
MKGRNNYNIQWQRPRVHSDRTTRHPDVAVNDILENLQSVQFQVSSDSDTEINGVEVSLSIYTHNEWYVITHWNKCICRMIGIEDGRAVYTDTTNLSDSNYNKILTTIEDYLGMSIYDFSFGMIEFK